jgi:hypothetical protein
MFHFGKHCYKPYVKTILDAYEVHKINLLEGLHAGEGSYYSLICYNMVLWPVVLKMEVVCSSEMLITTHQSAWCNNPQDHNVCLKIFVRVMVLLVFYTNHDKGHTEYGYNFTSKMEHDRM